MSFADHLGELRKVLFRSVIYLAVGFGICYHFGAEIQEILLAPLREVLGEKISGQVVYLGLLDKVLSQFQVSVWSSVLLTSPLWFKEIWSFISPGLHDHEKKLVLPFVFTGFIFFALGVCFGYFLVFPLTFETLMQFGVGESKLILD